MTALNLQNGLFAHYVIARKIANLERTALLKAVSEHFNTKLYTPNPTPELSQIHNMGSVDYQRKCRMFLKIGYQLKHFPAQYPKRYSAPMFRHYGMWRIFTFQLSGGFL